MLHSVQLLLSQTRQTPPSADHCALPHQSTPVPHQHLITTDFITLHSPLSVVRSRSNEGLLKLIFPYTWLPTCSTPACFPVSVFPSSVCECVHLPSSLQSSSLPPFHEPVRKGQYCCIFTSSNIHPPSTYLLCCVYLAVSQ